MSRHEDGLDCRQLRRCTISAARERIEEELCIEEGLCYFRAGGDSDATAATDFPVDEDLSYWRPSVGIAYRW